MVTTKPTRTKKAAATKPVAKVKPATAKPAATKPAADGSPSAFDGERLVQLLGAAPTDERVVAIVRELGYTKPISECVEVRKRGIALTFVAGGLKQIQFEIRRKWTGHARYEGRLPFGISADHKTADYMNTIAGHTASALGASNWSSWQVPGAEVSIGFGKTLLETVFVIAK